MSTNDEQYARAIAELEDFREAAVKVVGSIRSVEDLRAYAARLEGTVCMTMASLADHACRAHNIQTSNWTTMVFGMLVRVFVESALDGLSPEALRERALNGIEGYCAKMRDEYRATHDDIDRRVAENHDDVPESTKLVVAAIAAVRPDLNVRVVTAGELLEALESEAGLVDLLSDSKERADGPKVH